MGQSEGSSVAAFHAQQFLSRAWFAADYLRDGSVDCGPTFGNIDKLMESPMHDHGHVYRASITAANGQIEYSDWFNTEEALRHAMERATRDETKTYACEAKGIRCMDPACDADETPFLAMSRPPEMDREILQLFRDGLDAAQERRAAASQRFDEVIRQTRSGIPHPEGAERLRLVSGQYGRAMQEVTDALNRMNGYLIYGTIPPDLEARRKAAASQPSIRRVDEKTG
jgi:hypothetical protein